MNSQFIEDLGLTTMEEMSTWMVSGESNPDPNALVQSRVILRGVPNAYALRNGWIWYSPMDAFSTEKVEELRGPNAFLYGEADVGGANNQITKRGLLSRDLTRRHGKGFSRSNLIRIRQFYLAYPKSATPSHFLSWSHLVELLKIEDTLERGFYEKETINQKWSVRELQRQKKSTNFSEELASKTLVTHLMINGKHKPLSCSLELMTDLIQRR
jgi:hypothetical protein